MDDNSVDVRWITSKKYMPTFKPYQMSEAEMNRKYQVELTDPTFFAWMEYTRRMKIASQPREHLITYGFLRPGQEHKIKDDEFEEDRLALSTIPDVDCLVTQIKFVCFNKTLKTLVDEYVEHLHMLRVGRDIRAWRSDLSKRKGGMKGSRLFPDFSGLEKYNMLVDAILRAPQQCKSPIILVRGQETLEPFHNLRVNTTIVTTSIMSTTFCKKVVEHFSGGKYMFVFHLPAGIPWLYMNAAECEILIPPGLEMKLKEIQKIGKVKLYRFQVLRLVRDAERILPMKKYQNKK